MCVFRMRDICGIVLHLPQVKADVRFYCELLCVCPSRWFLLLLSLLLLSHPRCVSVRVPASFPPLQRGLILTPETVDWGWRWGGVPPLPLENTK